MSETQFAETAHDGFRQAVPAEQDELRAGKLNAGQIFSMHPDAAAFQPQ